MLTHAEEFLQYRPLLFSIAYRMLGSVVEAEDVLQDAYVRFQGVPLEEIKSPKSFLCTIATRLSLDTLKSARVKREEYPGPWLPEPLVTDQYSEDAETISMAFLVLLERLTPLERAVYLLHEVFDYSYPEVATILEKSQAYCRQLNHRAHQAIADKQPRFTPSKEEQERLVGGFLQAVATGDLDGLMAMLSEDVVHWTDGGGKVKAATRPLYGRDHVGRFFIGLGKKGGPFIQPEPRWINGMLSLIIWVDGQCNGVIHFSWAGEQCQQIHYVRNPEKLTRV